jgi:WD40 repeat protein
VTHHLFLLSVPTLISASRDHTIKLWDVESGECERTLEASEVVCLALTVDRACLISGCGNGVVLLWKLRNGQQLASFRCHEGGVSSVAVTPDGASFITGSWDNTIKLWNFDDPQQPALTFVGHTSSITSVIVSTDGSRVYSSSDDESIFMWNTATGERLTIMSPPFLPIVGFVSACLALCGSVLVSSSFTCVQLWDTANAQLLRTLNWDKLGSVTLAVTSDGGRVVSGDTMNKVFVWDVASGTQLAGLDGHNISTVYSTAVSSDDALAAASGGAFSGLGCSCYVWDLASNSLRFILRGHTKNVVALLFL